MNNGMRRGKMVALWATTVLASMAAPSVAPAQAQQAAQVYSFSIPAKPVRAAMNDIARISGISVVFAETPAVSVAGNAVRGTLSPQQAVAALLSGTGLSHRFTDSRTVTIFVPRRSGDSAAAGGDVVLGTITVQADGATTEGTNSYTTGETSSATGLALSLRETPQSVSVITRQRIDDQALGNVSKVLEQTSGITLSRDGGERVSVYSRGSEITNYQLDGVNTMTENQTRTMPQSLFSTALYDHVEVVRGATGLMTGAGEPSGSVNLVRKRPTAEFQGHVSASVGSWDDYGAEVDLSGPLTRDGRVRGRFVAATQDSQSFMDWYGQKRALYYGVVETDVTDSTVVRFSVDRQEFRADGAPGVPLMYDDGTQTDFSRNHGSGARWMYDEIDATTYTMALEQALANDWKLNVSASYMDVTRDVDIGWYRSTAGGGWISKDGTATGDRSSARADQSQVGFDVKLSGPFTLFGRQHDFISGLSYARYKNDHAGISRGFTSFNYFDWSNQLDYGTPGTTVSNYDVVSQQAGAYAATRLNVTDALHVIGGVRVTDYRYDYLLGTSTYQIRKRGHVTPYVGVVYDITPEQSVYASYTEIFKPQNSRDRTGKVLDPVVGTNYEAGWKGAFLDGALNASAAVFMVERDNVAEMDENEMVPGTTDNAYRAIKGAKTKGFEIEMSGQITENWNVQGGFSHAITRNPNGSRLRPNLPTNAINLWTTYRLAGDWDRLTIGGGVIWKSKSWLEFARLNARARQDDYAVINLMARYDVTEDVTATLGINNLFDKVYYSNMAGAYGTYGAPRNATLTVNYRFWGRWGAAGSGPGAPRSPQFLSLKRRGAPVAEQEITHDIFRFHRSRPGGDDRAWRPRGGAAPCGPRAFGGGGIHTRRNPERHHSRRL